MHLLMFANCLVPLLANIWRKSVKNTLAVLVNILIKVHNKYIKSTG